MVKPGDALVRPVFTQCGQDVAQSVRPAGTHKRQHDSADVYNMVQMYSEGKKKLLVCVKCNIWW